MGRSAIHYDSSGAAMKIKRTKHLLFIMRNVYTRIAGARGPAAEFIQKASTYRVKYYARVRAEPAWGGKPTYAPLKKTKDLSFGDEKWIPTGWVPLFEQALKKLGYTVHVLDCRTKPRSRDWPKGRPGSLRLPPMEPYGFQRDIVEVAARVGRGVLKIPTGGGKTFIAENLVWELGVSTLYIVPNLVLLDQVYEDFAEDFGEDQVGRIGDGKFDPKTISISTVQTLWARREDPQVQTLLKTVECLIIDECHVVGSSARDGEGWHTRQDKKKANHKGRQKRYTQQRVGNSWFEVARMCTGAYYRFGMSATPGGRKEIDGGLLRAMTGGVIVKRSTSDLIEEGYLTRPEIYMYYAPSWDPGKNSFFDLLNWNDVYKKAILENEQRNKLIADLSCAYARSGRTVLVTVSRVKNHGQPLYEKIKEELGEDQVAFVHGSTTKQQRLEVFQAFREKKIKVLIGTVFKMGFNVKSLDVIILADGGRKQLNTEQRVGRVLRLFQGKRAIVIDFMDDDNNIALGHSLRRMRYYLSEPAFEFTAVNFDIKEVIDRKPFIFRPKPLEGVQCIVDLEAPKPNVVKGGTEPVEIKAKIREVDEPKKEIEIIPSEEDYVPPTYPLEHPWQTRARLRKSRPKADEVSSPAAE